MRAVHNLIGALALAASNMQNGVSPAEARRRCERETESGG
jgi:hypothetical protein